jgi:hypothetical protein
LVFLLFFRWLSIFVLFLRFDIIYLNFFRFLIKIGGVVNLVLIASHFKICDKLLVVLRCLDLRRHNDTTIVVAWSLLLSSTNAS